MCQNNRHCFVLSPSVNNSHKTPFLSSYHIYHKQYEILHPPPHGGLTSRANQASRFDAEIVSPLELRLNVEGERILLLPANDIASEHCYCQRTLLLPANTTIASEHCYCQRMRRSGPIVRRKCTYGNMVENECVLETNMQAL